jgi:hypothetical protein
MRFGDSRTIKFYRHREIAAALTENSNAPPSQGAIRRIDELLG